MRKMKLKRYTALLLAFMLCLQLGAVSAFATDGENTESTAPAAQTTDSESAETAVSVSPTAESAPAQAVTQSEPLTAPAAASVGADKTSLLKSTAGYSFTVSQNGQPVDGTLDTGLPVTVECQLRVPVAGDADNDGDTAGVDPANSDTYVASGDWAAFSFGNALKLTNTADCALLTDKGVSIGAVSFADQTAKLSFAADANDNVFDGKHFEVTANFTVTLKYDAAKAAGQDTVEILGTTYRTVRTPSYTMAKSGRLSSDNTKIDWTVKVTAAYTDGGKLSLADCVVTDDLSQAGKYVDGSFKAGGKGPADGALAYTESDSTLTYTFPSDTTDGSAVLTYSTLVDQTAVETTGSFSADNSAELHKSGSDTLLASAKAATVSYKPTWIGKQFYLSDKTGTDITAQVKAAGYKFDYENYYITWPVTVDQPGYSLKTVVVTDKLPTGLDYVAAYTGTAAAIGSTALSDEAAAWSEKTRTLTLSLGDLDGKTTVYIVTKLDPSKQDGFNNFYEINGSYYPRSSFGFNNSASVSWDGSKDGGYTASKSTGTLPGTFSMVSKWVDLSGSYPAGYQAASHEVTWNMGVYTQGQSYGGKLRTMDLLIYGSASSGFTYDEIVGNGSDLQNVTKTEIKNLTRNYGMKYVAGSFADTGSTGVVCTVCTLKSKGVAVADLLIFTGANNTGFSSEYNRFSFKTTLTDPNVYANNGSEAVRNTAALFDNDNKLDNVGRSVNIPGSMLTKNTLPQKDGAALESDASALAAVNDGQTDGAFNYNTHTAYFRIYVNADGIDLAKDASFAGKTISLADTLPSGWHFEKFDGETGSYFRLFTGAVPAGWGGSTVSATAAVTDPASAVTAVLDGQTLNFTFKSAPQAPYILVVKAVMDDDTVSAAFAGNGTASGLTNSVRLTTEGVYKTAPSASATAAVSSAVLTKKLDQSTESAGYLTWTVDYNSYGLDRLTKGATALTLSDTIPEGIDLRTDKTGALKLDGNIALYELTLGDDGSLSAGTENVLTADLISYDLTSRTMKLTLPDPKKSYRLTYVTDVTGSAGDALENKATLSAGVNTESARSYQISAAAASASAKYGVSFTLTKYGDRGTLKGATYTLFLEDQTTPFRVRTTSEAGTLRMGAIPDGTYYLKETAAPDGYALDTVYHELTVTGDAVALDGSALADAAHSAALYDRNTNLATLTITKKVAGNAADSKKAFGFTVTLPGSESDSYRCVGTGVDVDTMHGGDNAIELSAGESVTITNLPADKAYTVTEKDYSTDGYTASVTLDGGAAETKNTVGGKTAAGKTDAVVFTNTRNVYYPVTPVTPSPSPSTPASPSPSTTPSEPTATVPDEPVPGGDKTVPSPSAPVTVPDDDVPTADKPVTPAGKTIPDGKTPTAATPKTGDSSALGLFGTLAGFSAAGLVCLLRGKRKNRSETRSR